MKNIAAMFLCLIVAYSASAQPWATMVQDYTTGPMGTFTDGVHRGSMGKLTFGQGIYSIHSKIYFNKLHNGHFDPYVFNGSQFTQLAELGTATYPRPYVSYNGKAYFIIIDGADSGLWESNGTPAGTKQVLNIEFQLPWWHHASTIYVLNGKMYFTQHYSENGLNKSSLWVSDGTAGGTSRLKEIAATPQPDGEAALWVFDLVNNKLILKGGYTSLFTWVSDGTENGTHSVQNDWEYTQAHYNGADYFIRYDNTGTGLYSTDGTQTGTQLVKQLYTGDMSASAGNRHFMDEYDGKLVFATFSGANASQLWISDGTDAGTMQLAEYTGDYTINPIVHRTAGGKYFFCVSSNPQNISYLAVTDGTVSGTKLVNEDFEMGVITDPYSVYELGSKLYYTQIGVNGSTLCYTDGTEAGTGRVAGGMLAPASVAPIFGTINNEMYLIGSNSTFGTELWRLFDFPLNVASVKDPAELLLYPNPANNSFNVNTEDDNNTIILIYSLMGQLLMQTKQAANIDIQALPAGIYNVQVSCNSKTKMAQLIKQ